jgi:hypothetical protein
MELQGVNVWFPAITFSVLPSSVTVTGGEGYYRAFTFFSDLYSHTNSIQRINLKEMKLVVKHK